MESLEKMKTIISKYLIYVLFVLVIIVLLLIFLPKPNRNNSNSNLTLVLKGNSNISIIKGEEYKEAGYIAHDTKEGDLTAKVTKAGYVDINNVGSYKITYRVINNKGKVAEAIRTINVIANLSDMNVEIDYSPKELTNEGVIINLDISGDGYDFTLDPDGNMSKENKITYKASENDEYIFSIKRKDGNVIEKIIEIENIDKKKPTGSCKAIINDQKTEVSVTANDESGIKSYAYNLNGKKYDSDANNYVINEVARDAVVTIYDKANNYEMINCILTDNTWPVKVSEKPFTPTTPMHYNQTLREYNLNYILYYPDDLDLSKKNPLVVFLHGTSECGDNIGRLTATNFAKNMKNGRFKGAIFLAPQCNCTSGWRGCFDNLVKLIDKIAADYNVDLKRISVTGHSLGGAAVYGIVSKCPDKFSVGVVLAGTPGSVNMENLKRNKFVVFYGTKDENYARGISSAKSLIKSGVNLKLYEISGAGHGILPNVYEEYNTIEWMIAQSR